MKSMESKIKDNQVISEKHYWKSKLSGNWSKTTVPFDNIINEFENNSYSKYSYLLANSVTMEVLRISNDQEYNIFVILLTSLSLLLSKYTRTSEIIIGAPILNQNDNEVLKNDSLFIRQIIDENKTYKELLKEIKLNVTEAINYQDFPISSLLKDNSTKNEVNRNSLLYDIGISYNQIHNEQLLPQNKLSLIFSFIRIDNELKIEINYNTNNYLEETIKNIAENVEKSLLLHLSNLDQKLSSLELINNEDKEKYILFNNTDKEISGEYKIHELFKEQAIKTPDNIAVIYGDEKILYKELDVKVDKLAANLQALKLQGSVVGICMDPSVEMIISILGIIKAGAVFLPIDPSLPDKRKKFMLEKCGSSNILSQSKLINTLNISSDISIHDIDSFINNNKNLDFKKYDNENLYVIFTSGSTGQPKGVEITHKNIFNYNTWFSNSVKLKNIDKGLITTSFAYDSVYTIIFSCLLSGAQLHLTSKEVYLNPKILSKYIDSKNITITKMTPSLLNILVNSKELDQLNFKCLRYIMIGGEKIKTKDIKDFNDKFKNVLLMNHYGPTETTIGSIATFINATEMKTFIRRPTLGKPIDNTKVYIVDSNLNLLPIGIPGEICISGAGVAKGYINDEKLSNEKFINNPFLPNKRLYKTGDIGRWLEKGEIEFLGRIDSQIKINGQRIELSEIEIQTKRIFGIEDVAVHFNTHNNTILLFYINSQKIESEVFKLELSNVLPSYMIPNSFVKIDSFPLTIGNKIDFKALTDSIIKNKNFNVETLSATELELVKIWAEILEVKENEIEVSMDFFENGGNSLKIISLNSLIHEKLNVKIEFNDLFNNLTIGSQALIIDSCNLNNTEQSKNDLAWKKEIL